MRFSNELGLPAAWTMGFRRDGREMLVVVVKATYTLPAPGLESVLADEQVALVEADRYTGEPGLSAPLHETDFAHEKPACDVLLVGSAYAPRGRATQVDVGLQVGTLMGGAVLTEYIFAWPGVGHWLIDAIPRRDYPALQGGIMLISSLVILINLCVDMLYGTVNPRIRHGR